MICLYSALHSSIQFLIPSLNWQYFSLVPVGLYIPDSESRPRKREDGGKLPHSCLGQSSSRNQRQVQREADWGGGVPGETNWRAIYRGLCTILYGSLGVFSDNFEVMKALIYSENLLITWLKDSIICQIHSFEINASHAPKSVNRKFLEYNKSKLPL